VSAALSLGGLEHFNRESGRRIDVVGIFPTRRAKSLSLVRLADMLRIEANDEWLVGRRYRSRAPG